MNLPRDLHDLELVVVDGAHMDAFADGDLTLQALLGVGLPAQWPRFRWALLPPDRGGFGARREGDWPGFFFICPKRKRLLGNGGFKGAPDPDGYVEIGYEIAPEHQGQGYATSAVAMLLSYAFDLHRAKGVRAHTLAEPNASNRVLEKVGMRLAGTTMDRDLGPIWCWSIGADVYFGHRSEPGDP